MFIAGLGTAVPAQRYSQRDCWDALCVSPQWPNLTPRSRAILKKVLNGDSGISSRHLALDNLQAAFDLTPDALHERFKRTAPALAAAAALRALQDAAQTRDNIDGLIISTCTGYLCPGLTSYVAERLNLKHDAFLLDLVGQGCGAALPNLAMADSLLRSGRCQVVLSVCVEVCSAAFYLDNDPGVLISACLFGDGAGAAVLTTQPGARSIRWQNFASTLQPADRELLRFDQKNGMLRNILAIQVPGLAARHAVSLFHDLLHRAHVDPARIQGWIFHPGGKDVLVALGREFRLHPRDLAASAAVLRNYGNVSSASLYFVLQEALRQHPGSALSPDPSLKGGAGSPKSPSISDPLDGRAVLAKPPPSPLPPGSLWWVSSFGAGFSCHGALLKVD